VTNNVNDSDQIVSVYAHLGTCIKPDTEMNGRLQNRNDWKCARFQDLWQLAKYTELINFAPLWSLGWQLREA